MAKPVINDHVKMTSNNGKVKPVPCWLIKDWETQGILSEVPYKFAGPEDGKNYEAWKAYEVKRKARNKARSGAPVAAQEGIAGAHLNLVPGEGAFVAHEPEALHGSEQPPTTGPEPSGPADPGAGHGPDAPTTPPEPEAGTSPAMDLGEGI